MVTSKELELLRKPFGILKSIVLEVPPPTEGVVDLKGFASKVAMFPAIFFNGLRVLFYHPSARGVRLPLVSACSVDPQGLENACVMLHSLASCHGRGWVRLSRFDDA